MCLCVKGVGGGYIGHVFILVAVIKKLCEKVVKVLVSERLFSL